MAKTRKQIAALPLRWTKKGKVRILLVTSRETRRWVTPKGWPMKGKKPWRAAEIEALEEAGVTGLISPMPVGTFDYRKKLDSGKRVKCRVKVFPMHVTKTRKSWKERQERTRKWFSPKQAARLVNEPELASILRQLSKKKKMMDGVAELREAS